MKTDGNRLTNTKLRSPFKMHSSVCVDTVQGDLLLPLTTCILQNGFRFPVWYTHTHTVSKATQTNDMVPPLKVPRFTAHCPSNAHPRKSSSSAKEKLITLTASFYGGFGLYVWCCWRLLINETVVNLVNPHCNHLGVKQTNSGMC